MNWGELWEDLEGPIGAGEGLWGLRRGFGVVEGSGMNCRGEVGNYGGIWGPHGVFWGPIGTRENKEGARGGFWDPRG